LLLQTADAHREVKFEPVMKNPSLVFAESEAAEKKSGENRLVLIRARIASLCSNMLPNGRASK
jgi:hypothetical protein